MLKTYYKINLTGYYWADDWFHLLGEDDPRDWLFETREEAAEIIRSHYKGPDDLGEEPVITIEEVSAYPVDLDTKSDVAYYDFTYSEGSGYAPLYQKEQTQDTHKEQFSTFGYYFG